LVLQVPADGTVDSLRELLDQLYEAHVAVEGLSIHAPDLDDVFLTVTGSHVAGRPDEDPTPRGAAQR
jgi:ABC-2 type transport system ATP-binding protein